MEGGGRKKGGRGEGGGGGESIEEEEGLFKAKAMTEPRYAQEFWGFNFNRGSTHSSAFSNLASFSEPA
jgi:hypothetical protein